MIEILIALICLAGIGVYGATNDKWGFIGGALCPAFAVIGMMGLLLYSGFAWYYVAAEHKAEVINREFGTNYTQQEVFYAESVIDAIREVQRQRVEINGDLITGEQP